MFDAGTPSLLIEIGTIIAFKRIEFGCIGGGFLRARDKVFKHCRYIRWPIILNQRPFFFKDAHDSHTESFVYEETAL